MVAVCEYESQSNALKVIGNEKISKLQMNTFKLTFTSVTIPMRDAE